MCCSVSTNSSPTSTRTRTSLVSERCLAHGVGGRSGPSGLKCNRFVVTGVMRPLALDLGSLGSGESLMGKPQCSGADEFGGSIILKQ